MIYFTSDTHFGHANVIKYCNRPYANVAEMEEKLIHNWNQFVRPEDEVWHLGDFAFQKPSDVLDIIQKLNGRIKLVPGNHDSRQLLNKLYELPESKLQVMERYVEFNYESRKFVLCHYPIESWNNMSHGAIHCHGHSHGNSTPRNGRFDVGVDAEGYFPTSIAVLIERAKAQPTPSRPDRGE